MLVIYKMGTIKSILCLLPFLWLTAHSSIAYRSYNPSHNEEDSCKYFENPLIIPIFKARINSQQCYPDEYPEETQYVESSREITFRPRSDLFLEESEEKPNTNFPDKDINFRYLNQDIESMNDLLDLNSEEIGMPPSLLPLEKEVKHWKIEEVKSLTSPELLPDVNLDEEKQNIDLKTIGDQTMDAEQIKFGRFVADDDPPVTEPVNTVGTTNRKQFDNSGNPKIPEIILTDITPQEDKEPDFMEQLEKIKLAARTTPTPVGEGVTEENLKGTARDIPSNFHVKEHVPSVSHITRTEETTSKINIIKKESIKHLHHRKKKGHSRKKSKKRQRKHDTGKAMHIQIPQRIGRDVKNSVHPNTIIGITKNEHSVPNDTINTPELVQTLQPMDEDIQINTTDNTISGHQDQESSAKSTAFAQTHRPVKGIAINSVANTTNKHRGIEITGVKEAENANKIKEYQESEITIKNPVPVQNPQFVGVVENAVVDSINEHPERENITKGTVFAETPQALEFVQKAIVNTNKEHPEIEMINKNPIHVQPIKKYVENATHKHPEKESTTNSSVSRKTSKSVEERLQNKIIHTTNEYQENSVNDSVIMQTPQPAEAIDNVHRETEDPITQTPKSVDKYVQNIITYPTNDHLVTNSTTNSSGVMQTSQFVEDDQNKITNAINTHREIKNITNGLGTQTYQSVGELQQTNITIVNNDEETESPVLVQTYEPAKEDEHITVTNINNDENTESPMLVKTYEPVGEDGRAGITNTINNDEQTKNSVLVQTTEPAKEDIQDTIIASLNKYQEMESTTGSPIFVQNPQPIKDNEQIAVSQFSKVEQGEKENIANSSVSVENPQLDIKSLNINTINDDRETYITTETPGPVQMAQPQPSIGQDVHNVENATTTSEKEENFLDELLSVT